MSRLLSIIVPVYNVKPYLEECLQSIAKQSYVNLEIILVDDGSTDGSGQVCDEWERKDQRFKVIHKENGGVSNARNTGLKAAHGDYIGFVDADDWIEPDMYEKLVDAIKNSDMAACGFYNYPMDNLDIKIHNGNRRIENCPVNKTISFFYEREGYFTSIWNKLFKRKLIIDSKGDFIPFSSKYHIGEDEVWLAEVFSRCNTTSFIPEALYHWRPRTQSATRHECISKKQMTIFSSKKHAMELLPQDKEIQSLVRAVMFNDCFSARVVAYCSGDKKRYRQITTILKPMKHDWLLSPKAKPLFKIKTLIMDIEMRLHLPVAVVHFTGSVRRFGIKRS